MIDFLGNPLAVGDSIAYKAAGPGLKKGLIVRVCAKSVWIDVPHPYIKGDTMSKNIKSAQMVKINAS